MDLQRDILLKFEKEKLADIIIDLLDRLNELEKNEFISKNIDAQLALDNMGEGEGFEFLKDVKEFCIDCLHGQYNDEDDYDNRWNDYYECDFQGCEWAELFRKYFNIALMYSRNKEYNIAYKAFELLFDCMGEAEANEEILGTDNPYMYIEISFEDVFNQYYLCMKNCISDNTKIIEIALEHWYGFGNQCIDAIINNIEDIELVEKIIRQKIEEMESDWTLAHLYFSLLKKFYEKYKPLFNKIQLAKSFLKYNANFYSDLAKENYEIGNWNETIKVINEALEKIEDTRIKHDLKVMLVACYENLNEFEDAFNTVYALLKEKPSYDLYDRSRYFASKINKLDVFIDDVINFLRLETSYAAPYILLAVLSRENLIEKLMDFIKNYRGYSRYEYLKYISKALIYRGFYGEEFKLINISEYIDSINISQIQGIVDIEVIDGVLSCNQYYLDSAVEVLKEMVKYHIDAAKRSRYERAAYYCGLVKDILYFSKKEEEFLAYYTDIMNQNKRRPALKDEMRRKIE